MLLYYPFSITDGLYSKGDPVFIDTFGFTPPQPHSLEIPPFLDNQEVDFCRFLIEV